MSVFWKQRDNQFFPTTCFVLPTTILRLPYSAINALSWSVIVYWATGLTYSAGRQASISHMDDLCATGRVIRLMGQQLLQCHLS